MLPPSGKSGKNKENENVNGKYRKLFFFEMINKNNKCDNLQVMIPRIHQFSRIHQTKENLKNAR